MLTITILVFVPYQSRRFPLYLLLPELIGPSLSGYAYCHYICLGLYLHVGRYSQRQ